MGTSPNPRPVNAQVVGQGATPRTARVVQNVQPQTQQQAQFHDVRSTAQRELHNLADAARSAGQNVFNSLTPTVASGTNLGLLVLAGFVAWKVLPPLLKSTGVFQFSNHRVRRRRVKSSNP